MKIKIKMMPEITVLVNRETVNLLMLASDSHYDSYCKSLSKSGGQILGWDRRLAFHQVNESYFEITRREADLIMKCTEGCVFINKDKDKAIMATFRDGLRKVIWIFDEAYHLQQVEDREL